MIEKVDRLGGMALVVGGPAVALAYLLHPPTATPEIVASTGWILIHVGFMVSLLGGVFGLMPLLAGYLRRGGGTAGVIGFVLAVTSLVFVFGLDYAEVFIFPTLAVEYPEVVARYGDGTMMPSVAFAFPLTGVAFVAGFLTLMWELRRVAAAPAVACGVTAVGVVVFGVGLSGLVPMLVVKTGATVFGAGLVLLGMAVLRREAGLHV